MVEVNVSIFQLAEVQHRLRDLDGSKTQKALARAVNQTAKKMQRGIADTVRQEYVVTLKGVKKGMKIKRATAAKPVAHIISEGKKIPLLQFSVSPKKRIYTGGTLEQKLYHSVKVKRSNRRKKILTSFIGKNVMLIRPREAIGAESHKPKDWLAFGPSVPEMIGSKKVLKKIGREGKEILRRQLDRAVREIVEGYRT